LISAYLTKLLNAISSTSWLNIAFQISIECSDSGSQILQYLINNHPEGKNVSEIAVSVGEKGRQKVGRCCKKLESIGYSMTFFSNITSSITSFLKGEDDDACTLAAAGDIDDAFNISATYMYDITSIAY
jgi:hypothetical protein